MKIISIQSVSLALDAMYRNYSKEKIDQKTFDRLCKDCELCFRTMSKIKDILINRKLLIVEGSKRSQVISWHPGKSAPNPDMLTSVYKEYTQKSRAEVKKIVAPKLEMTIEKACKFLADEGFTGIICKESKNNKICVIQKIDLSDFRWKSKGGVYLHPILILVLQMKVL